MPTINDKEAFFAVMPRLMVEDVEIPGYGVFHVSQISAGQRDKLEYGAQGKRDVRARIIVATVVDDGGNPLFTEADIPKITALPACVLEPLIEAANRINVLTAKDLDDLEKKSPSPPPSNS